MDNNKKYIDTSLQELAVFKDTRKDLFIYKKSERLCAAIYLISDILNDEEPLKWELRKEALTVIQIIALMMSGISHVERMSHIKGVSMSLMKVLSLIQVAHIASMLSEMNYDVLRKELEEMLKKLSQLSESSQVESQESKVFISKDFLSFSSEYVPSESSQSHNAAKDSFRSNLLKDTTTSQSTQKQPFSAGFIKDNSGYIHPVERKREVVNTDSNDIFSTKIDRSNTILSMLKSQGPLSIKDFTEKITDCSEKTIQRLLNQLVSRAAVKRIGERRWSKYML